jgi:hypothetical protein
MSDIPVKATLCTYQVGFGDCFLLSFHYDGATERHILIDFGTTKLPEHMPHNQMTRVAENIKERCQGKLQMVVATHRHKDHISGFATNGQGTGEIIRGCNPDVVIQPWTEAPEAQPDATQPVHGLINPNDFAKSPQALYISSLQNMHIFAEAALHEARHLADEQKFNKTLSKSQFEQLSFLAFDNGIKNESAVTNLNSMGSERHYVHFGYDKLDVSQLLPGVTIHILGPPTLEQHAEIQKQKSADKDEFWMLQAGQHNFWAAQAATLGLSDNLMNDQDELFPGAEAYRDVAPSHARGFIRRIRAMRADQLLQIVRILDNVLNNTSVILLFEVAGKKLLFPGDAQIENWEYALQQKEVLRLLKDTDLYKVGHHGSRNATPKTLWGNFSRKSDNHITNRLQTVASTLEGKHGDEEKHSEVPRISLVKELKGKSDYYTTQQMRSKNALYHEIEIRL